MAFTIGHEEAIRTLGAIQPRRNWSAFDVTLKKARAGNATLLVTTIWNCHSVKNEQGHRVPTEIAICEDEADGSLWYRIERPKPGTARKTAVAHWSRLELARKQRPIVRVVGVLKDVKSSKCSLEHVFNVVSLVPSINNDALWIQLVPVKEQPPQTRRMNVRAQLVTVSVPTMMDVTADLQREVERSSQLSREARRARLATAPKVPQRIEALTTAFRRNSDVIVEVLDRASGVCEGCGRPAPFLRRTDGSPFLEVHHRIPLAAGGEDTVENAVALCPNCHRGAHFG